MESDSDQSVTYDVHGAKPAAKPAPESDRDDSDQEADFDLVRGALGKASEVRSSLHESKSV